ncbi:hypothetical protein [Gymnodinialimonas sp.]
MNRIKTIALNALSIVLALALLGFFASLGLAVVGIALFVGLLGRVAARVAGFMVPAGASATKPATAL